MGDNGHSILEGLARCKFSSHIHFTNIFVSFFHENLNEDPKYFLDVCISAYFLIHLIYLNISLIKMFPFLYKNKRKKRNWNLSVQTLGRNHSCIPWENASLTLPNYKKRKIEFNDIQILSFIQCCSTLHFTVRIQE